MERLHKEWINFEQHQRPFYYFQIGSGKVKYSAKTRTVEFIQRFFHAGESFGEPPYSVV